MTRVDSVGALTVPVTAVLPDGSIFTVPTSVTFADGQKTADLVISYNPDDVVYGEYSDLTVQIGEVGSGSSFSAQAVRATTGNAMQASVSLSGGKLMLGVHKRGLVLRFR